MWFEGTNHAKEFFTSSLQDRVKHHTSAEADDPVDGGRGNNSTKK